MPPTRHAALVLLLLALAAMHGAFFYVHEVQRTAGGPQRVTRPAGPRHSSRAPPRGSSEVNCSSPAKASLVMLDRYVWGSGKAWGHFMPGRVGAGSVPPLPPQNGSCGAFVLLSNEDEVLRDLAHWCSPDDAHRDWYWNQSDVGPLRARLEGHRRAGPLLPLVTPGSGAVDPLGAERATPGILLGIDEPRDSRRAAKPGCLLQTVFRSWSGEFNDPRVDFVSNATVFPSGLVVWRPVHTPANETGQQRQSEKTCSPMHGTYVGRCQPASGMPLKQVMHDSRSAPQYRTVVSIALSDSNRNIYHFLMEALPGLSLVHSTVLRRNNDTSALKIHVASKRAPFVLEALAMLGFSERAVVDGVLSARELWLPFAGNCMRPALWQIMWLRQVLRRSTLRGNLTAGGLPGRSARSVIAVRRERTRSVRNWPEVLGLVRAFARDMRLDFREHTGEGSLLEQARLFGFAHTILAPHGAGSVFVAAAPSSDVRYIELRIPVDEWRLHLQTARAEPLGTHTKGPSANAELAESAWSGWRGKGVDTRRGLPTVPWLMYMRIANLYGMHVFSIPYGPARGVALSVVKRVLDLARVAA